MIITLDDKTRIRGTTECWQLEKRKNVKDQFEWRAFKYFTTMDSALQEAAQREIRTFPAMGVTEAIEASRRVTHKFAQILDDVGK